MSESFIKIIIFYGWVLVSIQCRRPDPLPPEDPGNGGIFLPDHFETLVVVDSIGRARHLAVNNNGDIMSS